MAIAIPTPPFSKSDLTAERALIGGLRSGDPASYERLAREYGGAMLAVARRFHRDEDDARDAVHDAFIAAVRAMRVIREDARLSSWLHRITVNACLMKLRSARRHPTSSLDDLLPRFDDSGHQAEPAGAWTDEIEAVLDTPNIRARVRGCIEKLPESYRAVLICRDLNEMDGAETSKALGLSVENVKTRLHRARQALKSLIERECKELVE
ncbi:MAG: sigma-70 family RNA polymerase sigma factor [Proteobacteria bacterium]|nr:sigma-70 family RNA polymerase sigma factor [Pseudomonadota bacterium]